MAQPGAFDAPVALQGGYPVSMIPSIANWPSPTNAITQFDPTINVSLGLTGGNQSYMPLFGMTGYSSYAIN